MYLPTQKTVVRFGKASAPILQQKGSFFKENEALRANVERICEFYSKQPLRTACKNCAHQLSGAGFTMLAVRYIICQNCGHLNGANEETDEFCRFVYTDDAGDNYAKNYSAPDENAYAARLDAIYKPKAEFLRDVLTGCGETPEHLAFADMGAGSGYFVGALVDSGLPNVTGYEVSEAQLRLARTMVKEGNFRQHSLPQIIELARSIETEVVSLIGVLEHLQDPRAMLDALRLNGNVRYVYMSVPMFSLTVYLEATFSKVFHRQLGAAHTHLYTESSLAWMRNEFQFDSVGEWWFGTDIVDLLRAVQVSLAANPETSEMADGWRELLLPLVDSFQLQLDSRRLSSEVHLVLKKVA
jgi:methyltransferase family protein